MFRAGPLAALSKCFSLLRFKVVRKKFKMCQSKFVKCQCTGIAIILTLGVLHGTITGLLKCRKYLELELFLRTMYLLEFPNLAILLIFIVFQFVAVEDSRLDFKILG